MTVTEHGTSIDNLFSLLLSASIVFLGIAVLMRGRRARRGTPDEYFRAHGAAIEKLLGPDNRFLEKDGRTIDFFVAQELRLALALENAFALAENDLRRERGVPSGQATMGSSALGDLLPEWAKEFLKKKVTRLANGLISRYTGLGGGGMTTDDLSLPA
jgi:hypothetical protein